MHRALVAYALLVGLGAGCCVAERAVDVGVETAGKVTSKAIDAVASSDDDSNAAKRR